MSMQCRKSSSSFARLTFAGSLVIALLSLPFAPALQPHRSQRRPIARPPPPPQPHAADSTTPPIFPNQPDPTAPTAPRRVEKPPALIDPAGPAISLVTSESLFTVAAGLNACGYDDELEASDPVRAARSRADDCRIAGLGRSAHCPRQALPLYRAAPPLQQQPRPGAVYLPRALSHAAARARHQRTLADLPPDSTQIVEILPLLRAFADAVDLHVIWTSNHVAYDDLVNRLHDPLTKMILTTSVYLKMPTSNYDGRRFVVVLEPLLAPSAINARVYATDYVVVASPVNGEIRMRDVRHTYLHYEIEPLLFARSSSTDRLLPILKAVRGAPLDYVYRSDIVTLVIECLVRAIEARTMDTGIPVYVAPPNAHHSDMAKIEHDRNESQQKAEAVRQQAVNDAMIHGFVLTAYFYGAMKQFESDPASLKDSFGEIIYGMDVDAQVRNIKKIEFASEGSQDVLRRVPRQLRGLDLAELKLMQGDSAAAAALAQQALAQQTADPARANFILARCAIQSHNTQAAVDGFEQTIQLSKDPRMLAWSHIYLGRIYDINDQRDEAVEQYKAALTVRDGQADTKQAAEKGIKEPYAVPTRPAAQSTPAPPAQSTPPPAAKP